MTTSRRATEVIAFCAVAGAVFPCSCFALCVLTVLWLTMRTDGGYSKYGGNVAAYTGPVVQAIAVYINVRVHRSEHAHL